LESRAGKAAEKASNDLKMHYVTHSAEIDLKLETDAQYRDAMARCGLGPEAKKKQTDYTGAGRKMLYSQTLFANACAVAASQRTIFNVALTVKLI
jgi:hypothetical protein